MKWLVAGFAFALLVGCQKVNDSSADDNTTSADLAATLAELSTIAGAGATGTGYEADEVLNPRTTCASVGFSGCTTDRNERNFSSPSAGYCTRGAYNLVRTYGKGVLTYVNVTGCDFAVAAASDATPPTVTHAFDNHYMQLGANGRRLLVYTGAGTVSDKTIADADLKDFEGNLRSGGVTIKKYAASRKLTIGGIHRRGVGINGKYTLWHTIYSDADGLVVTDGAGATRIVNGTMYLMHNRISRKITQTLTNVTYEVACRFPTSGTTSFAWTGGSMSITWGTCGTATIDGVSTTLETES